MQELKKLFTWFISDVAEMGSLSSNNADMKLLWCVIDVFIKYVG